MKAGRRRIHHAAHFPDSSCSFRYPETLVHFNCKFHVAQQLGLAVWPLWAMEKCRDCGEPGYQLVAKRWDAVQIETPVLGNYIPDISLWHQGKPVAGIEIFVTHRVDENKAARYDAADFSWIEVKGRKSLYAGDRRWIVHTPLAVLRYSDRFDFRHRTCKLPHIAPLPASWQIPFPRWMPNQPLTDSQVDGHHCVACGADHIAYASNSGPLCSECHDSLEIRLAADSRSLNDEARLPYLPQRVG